MNAGLRRCPRILPPAENSVSNMVVQGWADIGVLYSVPPALPEGYVCDWVIDLPAIAIVHRKNPLASVGLIEVADLNDKYLIRSTGPFAEECFLFQADIVRRCGFTPRYRVKPYHDMVELFLSIRPDEYTFWMEDHTGYEDINQDSRVVRFKDPVPTIPVYLFYDNDASQDVLTFVRICHELAEEGL